MQHLFQEDPEVLSLVRRSQAGDLEAYGTLVTRQEGRILRLVGEILGSSATMQDLEETTLSVFEAAWRDLRRLRAPEQFHLRLAQRTVRTALKRPLRGQPDPVDALPHWERAAVRLHFTGRHTAAEIGTLLGRTDEDVWALLYAGCRRLAATKASLSCTEPG